MRFLFAVLVVVSMGGLVMTWALHLDRVRGAAQLAHYQRLTQTQQALIDFQCRLIDVHARVNRACFAVTYQVMDNLGLDRRGALGKAIGGLEEVVE